MSPTGHRIILLHDWPISFAFAYILLHLVLFTSALSTLCILSMKNLHFAFLLIFWAIDAGEKTTTLSKT